jgi:hypothetical protein
VGPWPWERVCDPMGLDSDGWVGRGRDAVGRSPPESGEPTSPGLMSGVHLWNRVGVIGNGVFQERNTRPDGWVVWVEPVTGMGTR